MKSFILNAHHVEKSWNPSSLVSNEFRKATQNMRYCFFTVTELLAPFQELIRAHSVGRMGIFLGTSHGELEPTIEFLKNLAPSKVVNPIHFQNSLHNSTLGFITQRFSLTSPGMTTTNLYFSAEGALEMAQLALHVKQVDFALVLACDTIPTSYEELFLSLYQESHVPVRIKSGAASLLLCSEHALLKFANKLHPLCSISSLRCHYDAYESSLAAPLLDDYYDSDALEKISLHLRADKKEKALTLLKPDGTYSTMTLDLF